MPKPIIVTCARGPETRRPDQAAKIRGIVEVLGHTVAMPAQARERLGWRGGDHVRV